jgi:conjugative transfer protein CagX
MKSLFSVVHRYLLRACFLLLGCAAGCGSPILLSAETGARVVKYAKEDIVEVHAKLRFSTLIVLPDDEEILDFTTGDREFWIINGSHNLCYVHPAQSGIRSNLNLVTASGHVYSFLLTEIGGDSAVQPDLKLFIEPKETSAAATVLRGYVHAAEAEAYKKELADLRRQSADEVRAAEARATEEVSRFRSTSRNCASTIRSSPNGRASRFWFPRFITTTPSPTFSPPRVKSRCFTKSRTASRTSCRSNSKTASTSFRRWSTPAISRSARRNSRSRASAPRDKGSR